MWNMDSIMPISGMTRVIREGYALGAFETTMGMIDRFDRQ